MSKLFMRVTAAFLVFGAVIGLLLSLAMIVLVFPAKAAVSTATFINSNTNTTIKNILSFPSGTPQVEACSNEQLQPIHA